MVTFNVSLCRPNNASVATIQGNMNSTLFTAVSHKDFNNLDSVPTDSFIPRPQIFLWAFGKYSKNKLKRRLHGTDIHCLLPQPKELS